MAELKEKGIVTAKTQCARASTPWTSEWTGVGAGLFIGEWWFCLRSIATTYQVDNVDHVSIGRLIEMRCTF